MTDRYDAMTFREINGKHYPRQHGNMVKNRNGDGWTLFLDSMPAPVDGQWRIAILPPKERDDRERSANADRRQAQDRSNGGGAGGRGFVDDDGDIPFARNDTVW